MLSAKETGFIYETVLGTPGMNNEVRVDFRVPRKNIIFICKLIELGMSTKDSAAASGLLSVISEETLTEVKNTIAEMLSKAGLKDTNERLMQLLALQSK